MDTANRYTVLVWLFQLPVGPPSTSLARPLAALTDDGPSERSPRPPKESISSTTTQGDGKSCLYSHPPSLCNLLPPYAAFSPAPHGSFHPLPLCCRLRCCTAGPLVMGLLGSQCAVSEGRAGGRATRIRMDRCSKQSSKRRKQPEPVSISDDGQRRDVIKRGNSIAIDGGLPQQERVSYCCQWCICRIQDRCSLCGFVRHCEAVGYIALSMLIPGSGNCSATERLPHTPALLPPLQLATANRSPSRPSTLNAGGQPLAGDF